MLPNTRAERITSRAATRSLAINEPTSARVPAEPAHTFLGWLNIAFPLGIAALAWAGWREPAFGASGQPQLTAAAIRAIGLAVVTCTGSALVIVWLHEVREERVGRRQREAIRRRLATRPKRVAAGVPATIAAASKSARLVPARRADAPHTSADGDPNHVSWVPWPTFARLVTVEKFHARERGRPFTLLHLRSVKHDQFDGTRSVRIDRGHEPAGKLRQLVNAAMRSTDVASVSPSGDCFMLVSETAHEAGRSVAGRIVTQIRPVLGAEQLVEIREFTYVGSRKSEAIRIAGPLAA